MGGVINFDLLPVCLLHLVNDARVSRDDIHIELPAQSLLYDLHVEQTEKTTAETEAQSHGILRLIDEGGIVDLQFSQGGFQMFEISGIDRVNPAEDHRMNLLKPR